MKLQSCRQSFPLSSGPAQSRINQREKEKTLSPVGRKRKGSFNASVSLSLLPYILQTGPDRRLVFYSQCVKQNSAVVSVTRVGMLVCTEEKSVATGRIGVAEPVCRGCILIVATACEETDCGGRAGRDHCTKARPRSGSQNRGLGQPAVHHRSPSLPLYSAVLSSPGLARARQAATATNILVDMAELCCCGLGETVLCSRARPALNWWRAPRSAPLKVRAGGGPVHSASES